MPCQYPIMVPAAARSLLAAHRHHRRLQRAAGDERDALFVRPTGPFARTDRESDPPARVLLQGVGRVCDRLNLAPPFLHRGDCRYGADQGLIRRHTGWMTERGLHLAVLPAHLVEQLTTRPAHRDHNLDKLMAALAPPAVPPEEIDARLEELDTHIAKIKARR